MTELVYTAKQVKISSLILCKRKGKKFWASCPFHTDKTPSFIINDIDPQTYHCFSCQRHGSVIDFIMEREGVTFFQAIKYLNNVND